MSVEAATTVRFFSYWGRVRKFLGVTSERIYILPTWYCLVFNLLLLILFFASFPLRNPTLLILVFALVFIQLLSMVETHVNLREIEIKANEDYLIETHQQSELLIRANSRERSFGLNFRILDGDIAKVFPQDRLSRRALRRLLFNEFTFAIFRSYRSDVGKESEIVTVSSDGTIIRLPFLSDRRGVFRMPPIIVTSFFPFGLFRAVKVVSLEGSYVSYPVPRESIHNINAAEDQVARDLQRAGMQDSSNSGLDYVHHREFLAGDPLRRIDWKASSRRGLKMVKVFASSGVVRGAVLRWQDTTAEDDEGKLSELAFSVLKATKDGSYFSLELPKHKTSVSNGESHKRECLRLLAAFER